MDALIATGSPAYEAGRSVGSVIWFVVLGLGALKCFHIARRPTTSAPCTVGLGVVLLGIAVGQAIRFTQALEASVLVRTLPTIAGGTLVAAGIVLAIVGLAWYRRPGIAYVQGTKQAVWAIVIGGLILLIWLGAAAAGLRGMLLPRDVVHPSPAAPGGVVTFEAEGFRFRMPPAPWVQARSEKIGAGAILSLARPSPLVYMNVSADEVLETGLDTAAFCNRTKALIATADGFRDLGETPHAVNGLDGILLENEGSVNGNPFRYVHWFYATDARAYRAVGWTGSRLAGQEELRRHVTEALGGFELIAAPPTPTAAARPAAPPPATPALPAGSALEFPDLNFRFDDPGKPWVRMDAKAFNKEACIAFIRRKPHTIFFVIAESGVEDADLAGFVEIVKGNLQSAAAEWKIVEERPRAFAGIEGVWIVSDIVANRQPMRYAQWVGLHGGCLYQLAAFSGRADQEGLEARAADMFARIRLIDPARATPADPAPDFRSAAHGYSMEMRGSGWSRWADLDAKLKEAEFGATRGPDWAFAVIPALLAGTDPPIDALMYGLADTMDLPYPDALISNERRFEDGGAEVLELETHRKDKEKWKYLLRAVKRERTAFLVALWKDAANAGTLRAESDALLARLRLEPEPATATALELLTPAQRTVNATVLNDAAIYLYNRERFAEAEPILVAAAKLNPENAVIFSNIIDARRRMGRHADALALLEREGARFAPTPRLLRFEALLRRTAGREGEAADSYARLFAAGHRDDDDVEEYGNLLWKLGRREEAFAAVERYLAGGESTAVEVFRAGLVCRRDGCPASIDHLAKLIEKAPFRPQLSYELIDHAYEIDRNADVLRACERLVAEGYDSEATRYLRGRSEYGLKWYAKAKASLEAALAKDPTSERAKKLLARVSTLLGEGDNTSIKQTIEPVAMPPSLAARLGPLAPTAAAVAVAPPGVGRDPGAFYLRRVTAITYTADAPWRVTEYRQVKVLDAAGISEFSLFEYELDPLAERAFVNRLEVRDASGALRATGDVADCYVVDRRDRAPSQKKLLHIPVPGLEPGSVVDLVLTFESLGPRERFPFREQGFLFSAPAARAALVVRGDLGAIHAEAWSGRPVAPEGGQGFSAWIVDQPPAYRDEPRGDDVHRYAAGVWIGDARGTWEEEAKEYLGTIAERLKPEPGIEALAREQAAGLEEPAAKVGALARHVQQRCTYRAVAFGPRAYVPEPVAEIARDRNGDCKDHALLLHHLLRATGIRSFLALANTRGPVVRRIASLDQFDHMVVFVPDGEGGRALDCTDKETDLAKLPSFGLVGEEIFVLDPARPRFVRLPPAAEDDAGLIATRAIRLAGGDARVEERLEFTGHQASFVRRYVRGIDAAERRGAIQGYMTSEGGRPVELEKVDVEGLDDPAKPLVLRLNYRVPGALQQSDAAHIGRLPAMWERILLVDPYVQERATPFNLPLPLSVRSTVSVHPPPGHAATLSPAAAGSRAPWGSATWSSRTEARADGSIVLRAEVRRGQGRFAAGEYEAYRAAMGDALRELERDVRVAPIAE